MLPEFVKTVARHLFTGVDNSTFDLGRVAWAVSIVAGIACSLVDVICNKKFDPQSYGIGIGSLLFGGGAGIAVKAKTEPGA